MTTKPKSVEADLDEEALEEEPPTYHRWEDEAFALNRPIAIVTGTREEILAGGGDVRIVRDEAGLDPLRVDRLTRQDFAAAAKIMAAYPQRRRAA